MAWIILLVAGLLEVGWATFLKLSDGLSKPIPSLIAIVLMVASLALLALALKQLPVSVAYAIWTGIGAVGTALVGIFVLKESSDWPKLVCLSLIAAGIVGLKVVSKT